MPPKKRQSLGRQTAPAKRKREERAAEAPEERENRLAADRIRTAAARAVETLEEHEQRLQNLRSHFFSSRARETELEHSQRLLELRSRARTSRTARSANTLLEAFRYDPSRNYAQLSVITFNKTCPYCRAKLFNGEAAGLCCKNGKVKLTPLEALPRNLMEYTTGTSETSRHFLSKIRRYNSCLQMTSFGATSVVQQPGFCPTFTVQGQVYHRIGSLLPTEGTPPKYVQLYFMGDDEDTEATRRCNLVSGVRKEIVVDLQHMLHEQNELVKTFKTALENAASEDYRVIIRADRRPAGEHERRFNAPQVNEVAVVFSNEEAGKRDIVLHRRGHALQRISETNRSYDALQYPILFPQGQDGYHFLISQINPATGEPTSRKVSSMAFYAYRLMIRSGENNHLLNCRQLFHQFLVDMYAKIETERLVYIRTHQQKLRVEEYAHLRDAIANDGNLQDLGALVILPSSFAGSPRHMHEYTQDAMAYVRLYGTPDLFITFTSNPSWEEFKDLLEGDQKPSDRHDLIARVFRQKQMKLIDTITKSSVFGEVRCWMYTVEWQKRGLPHSHNLIWLKEKIRPDQIDQIISAELPSPDEDPVLHAIVTRSMIHGPCGNLNRNSPCMKDGKCSKRYPRALLKETQTGNDGYPLYRRRAPEDGGFVTVIRRGGLGQLGINNSWVVPYSPMLSKMFDAHLNVEYCNSIKSIKYVCKYVNKGSDMAVFGLGPSINPNDEITRFQLGRYISSNEAAWRIFSFPVHERHPAVFHLSVHLENGQRVYFTASSAQRVAEGPARTTLTAFFLLCQEDPFAKALLYSEVPRYYTWNAARKMFNRRKNGTPVPGQENVFATDAIGRVYTVHPNNAECFYLRMLLLHVRGPTSFSALKTVDETECRTFREACLRLGLLEDDRHWDCTLNEAQTTSSAAQLRSLFAVLLTTCSPSNPQELWDKYRESMSDDIINRVRRANPTDVEIHFTPEIFNEALILLENRCVAMANKKLNQLGLESPNRENHQDILEADYLRETNYDIDALQAYIEANRPLLNEDQSTAYNTIMNHISSERGGAIMFLDAPGGTGKTFLINVILAAVRSQRQVALAVASSGIAATLMEGGRTAHSALKLPLNVATQETPVCHISKRSGQAKVLRACKIIVWDECTMAHKKSLEALNVTLRDLRESQDLMGGTLLLLCGDFRQTLPIIPKATHADEINACLKQSSLWRLISNIGLRENMRIRNEGDEVANRAFAETLLKLGDGKLATSPANEITFPDNFCQLVTSSGELIEAVYPNLQANYLDRNWLCERTILAARNDDVGEVNDQILKSIEGPVREYKSMDSVMDSDEAVNYPTEFLNSLNPAGFPPHILKLKFGVPIILLRNLDPPKLCNGTRLCVKQMMPNLLEAIILTGKGKGEIVYIPRIPLIPTDLPFDFKRLQFPVRLAFSITINKSQGQSIKYCGINLKNPCFSHGQLYVACSRVGSSRNLFIYTPNGSRTTNIVHQQVLN